MYPTSHSSFTHNRLVSTCIECIHVRRPSISRDAASKTLVSVGRNLWVTGFLVSFSYGPVSPPLTGFMTQAIVNLAGWGTSILIEIEEGAVLTLTRIL